MVPPRKKEVARRHPIGGTVVKGSIADKDVTAQTDRFPVTDGAVFVEIASLGLGWVHPVGCTGNVQNAVRSTASNLKQGA